MTRFLLSIYQPDGPMPGPEIMDQVGRDLHAFNEELKTAGAWVFTGGLQPAQDARVVRRKVRDTLVTDGPFTEGKEHVGGFWIIEAADLDAATQWGGKAAAATTLPIEVREFQDGPEY